MDGRNKYIVGIIAAVLSVFFAAALCIGANARADSVPAQAPASKSAGKQSGGGGDLTSKTKAAGTKTSGSQNNNADKAGGVLTEGFYSSGSSSKPYSPFATKISSSPSSSPALDSVPTSFGSGWTPVVETFASNNLLNPSDPASAQSPSITPEATPKAVISFLESKGITIATAAETEITNEVKGLINTYDNHPSLITGAPLARIFAIQILCMENKSGQLVYPETFPKDVLGKNYQSEYQKSWTKITQGKSYLLDSTYIYNSISYTTSNVIWDDPALNHLGWTVKQNVYSLDQIEQHHLSSMKAKAGKVNSLNLIGITKRDYTIATYPPTVEIKNGYRESSGNNGDASKLSGPSSSSIYKPGSTASVNFTVMTGPGATSALNATYSLSGAPDARIISKGFNARGQRGVRVTPSDFSLSIAPDGRSADIKWISKSALARYVKIFFTLRVEVTASTSNMAEVCSVAQESLTSNGGTLSLNSQSYVWCFAVDSLSQSVSYSGAADLTSSGSPATVSMVVPGWIFQYDNSVSNILWSTLKGEKSTPLSQYSQYLPSLPDLDKYTVNAKDVKVEDLATGEDVTSFFNPSFEPSSSFDTEIPYSSPDAYGGYALSPASLTVSWNGSWKGSSVGDPGLWGYGDTPIGYDMFEVTFPLALQSSVGGEIYSQAATSQSLTNASLASASSSIPTPASQSAPSSPSLTETGVKGPDGSLESPAATATLGVPMEFEAEADFPSAAQISAMNSTGDALIFYSYDAASNVKDFNLKVDGLSYNSLPIGVAQAQDGAVVLMFTPSDISYIKENAHDPSKLTITYDWYVTSAPSRDTSEIGFVQGSSLNLSAPTYAPTFISSSAAINLAVNSNGTGPLTPNAKQSSALTGIWFQNQLLSGADAKGAEFTVQNDTKGSRYYGEYLTPSSDGKPPYSYSSSPYGFKSTNGDGLFRMWGLADGTYKVAETKLPKGASGALPTFEVALDWAKNKPSSISAPNSSSALVDGTADIIYNQVEGAASGTGSLPYTGGHDNIAKILFSIALSLLLAGAGYASYKIYKKKA
ncbi:MAG: hypothetical protein IKS61_00840 [Aeriscardovia sp.]|nr:hypothetical protein [Aeriscardovia sp.]